MQRMSLGERVDVFAPGAAIRQCLLFTLVVVLHLPAVPPIVAQEGSVTVVMEQEPSRKHAVGSLQWGGVVYVSLYDLARALSFRVSEHRQDGSLTITAQSVPVTFFPDNPFVATVNRAGNKIAIQLPGSVVSSGASLYLPLAACVPFFEQLFGTRATFQPADNILSIGKPGPPKPAFDITSLNIESKVNGIVIRLVATRPLALYEGLLKEDGWYYFTVPNTKADIVALNKTKPTGAVKKIVATQFTSSVQIVFRLDKTFASSEITKDPASNDLVITLRSMSDEAMVAIEEKKRSGVTEGLERHRKKYELDVIVLDPGHGGRDPGAIGVLGTREKDVALGIALKLGKLIRSNLKGVKVVFTRDDDTFVELDRRGQIANEAGGKLFISIHCNSMPRKPSPYRGFEVYLLRPGRTDEAIAIAERENSVIKLEEGYEQRYKHLTDDNFILVTMAQSAHLRASEMFAEIATKEMSKRLDTRNNGVKQAGFYVLVGSAMPNVLVETAYLSNREDEKMLRSESGQEKIADALFNAIKTYKLEYEKLLQEGKDFGEK
jgi:N-acetylmuramoyl-L-alanine amidase